MQWKAKCTLVYVNRPDYLAAAIRSLGELSILSEHPVKLKSLPFVYSLQLERDRLFKSAQRVKRLKFVRQCRVISVFSVGLLTLKPL